MADVALRGVRKQFGKTPVINGVDLHIRDGEFVVFVGPSGCGKSTLLRLVAGLESVSAGQLLIGARDVTALPPKDRGVAMVFQSYALYPHMTVRRNIAFGLHSSRLSRVEIDDRVRGVAEKLALTPMLERLPRELSGGQRQRVAIGRAIVRDPSVFLFDEPLSNLDASLRVQMRIEIARLHRELGTTMVYVTHDQVEAMTLADRIVVLNGGRIEQVGTPEQLYARPDNLFVAGFIGSLRMNLLPGQVQSVDVDALQVQLDDGESLRLAAPAAGLSSGTRVTVGIRPEHLGLAPEPGAGVLRGVTEGIESLGDAHLLYLRTGAGQVVCGKLLQRPDASPGSPQRLWVQPGCCHLFDAAGRAIRG